MQLNDIIHLYMGCKFDFPAEGIRHVRTLDAYNYYQGWEDIRLHLRPLTDMTEEEARELVGMELPAFNKDVFKLSGIYPAGVDYTYGSGIEYDLTGFPTQVEDCRTQLFHQLSPTQFHYLLQRGFDLFGGIEAGWAVDAKTVNNNTNA